MVVAGAQISTYPLPVEGQALKPSILSLDMPGRRFDAADRRPETTAP